MMKLFTPTRIGAIDLAHRVVHAPSTRLRALADETPSPMMVDYYRQRASQGGLFITESAHRTARILRPVAKGSST
jgi:N-ethylmaleimide reductase